VSTSRFFGILFFSAALYAQMPAPNQVAGFDGQYPTQMLMHPPPDDIEPGFLPDAPDLDSFPPPPKPISGVVSVHELEHPIPAKALRAAYHAQKFSKKHKIAKAIEELQKAIRIAPYYRDAYCNLGVQYARTGRLEDARAEFQKAIEIGPPAALIYADLALTFSEIGNRQQAAFYARKALEIDPGDSIARALASEAQ